MNGPTFRLLLTTMGLDLQRAADELDVALRTVQRWNRQDTIPFFAEEWAQAKWQAWLDRIDRFTAPLENLPAGTKVDLSVYLSQEQLEKAGGARSLGEVDAINRALTVVLSMMDLVPVANLVPEEA